MKRLAVLSVLALAAFGITACASATQPGAPPPSQPFTTAPATTAPKSTTPKPKATTKKPPPPKTTKPPANCDPSYPDACLHDGIGDYDCAGGSGNGPNYVQGPIRVLPPDPFGLDANHDGWGCTG